MQEKNSHLKLFNAKWNKPSTLTPIEHKSLKAESIEQIHTAILRGELKPGERVTELGLARKLGVGQATIREAFIELEHQGFIQRVDPRKTLVTVLGTTEINEIYQIRMCLETLAVELLVAKEDKALRSCQIQCQKIVEAANHGRVLEFTLADLDFHRELWRSTGNQSLADLLERLVPKLFAFVIIQRTKPSRQELNEAARQHGLLLQLIREGQELGARVLIEESMRQAWSEDLRVSKWISRRPGRNSQQQLDRSKD
jgi:DNA-binding GntR family transcriptional regulator